MRTTSRALRTIVLIGASVLSVGGAWADVALSPLIADNMVLQRDIDVPIWGEADAGETVTVEFLGQAHSAVADKEGQWEVRLSPLEAGGPHRMTIRGRNSITLSNILVGEVWVASGQSNMAFAVQGSINAGEELAAAKYPEIRLFGVEHVPAIAPSKELGKAHWSVCSPESVGTFSGVAYFFGRKLHQDLKAPVGLIDSSWGGSNAETWTPAEAFNRREALKPIYEQLVLVAQNPEGGRDIYKKVLSDWEAKTGREDPGNRGFDRGWAKAGFDVSEWQVVEVPGVWESYGPDWQFDGAVWFKKDIEIPEAWAGQDLALDLGVLDDYDVSYFNGEQIGATGAETPSYWAAVRKYVVPGRLVKAGRNVIAIRVFDHYLEGGIKGGGLTVAPVAGGEAIDLSGSWICKVEVRTSSRHQEIGKPVDSGEPGAFNSPTSLYNGMIHPLIPYAIRGAIWYQGESNAGQGEAYRVLLGALIEGWRKAWDQGDFPFLIVQLANYQAREAEPTDAAWAHLRAGQAMTVGEVKNTALAVAIDVGEAEDIHPRDKQTVGYRLALAAERIAYGLKVPYSGPVFRSVIREGRRLRIVFDHVEDGLVVKGEKLEGFAVAGEDRRFVWAEATVEGDTVVVWSEAVARPASVRYAWAMNPACNLYNSAGLPAVPFRTDDW